MNIALFLSYNYIDLFRKKKHIKVNLIDIKEYEGKAIVWYNGG